MALKRNRSKSRSWFQRAKAKSSAESRHYLANHLKTLRKDYFSTSVYERGRRIKEAKNFFGFDLASEIKKRLPARGKLCVLDAGAGFLGVSSSLKKQDFGKRLFVTALDLQYPKIPKKVKKDLRDKIKKEEDPETKRQFKILLSKFNQVEKHAKLVDEIRTSPLETLSTKRKYDVIFDLYGAAHYTWFPERVVEQYFKLLKPNGTAFIAADSNIAKISRAIQTAYGPKSGNAIKTGFFLKFRRLLPKAAGYEIRKLPCLEKN